MQIADLTDVVAVTRGLVDIDSTTGREGDVVLWAATLLSQAGYEVVEQVVQGPRRNLYAAFGKADVVFSTHLDCVPPFFPSRLEGRHALRPRIVRRQGRRGVSDCGARDTAARRRDQRRPPARGGRRARQRRREDRARAGVGFQIPCQWRAHRQQAGHRHARHPARESQGVRPRRAFVVSRARRICRGETARCARRASRHRNARTRADGPHALHRGRAERRCGTQRRARRGGSRSHVPHRWRSSRRCAGRCRRSSDG